MPVEFDSSSNTHSAKSLLLVTLCLLLMSLPTRAEWQTITHNDLDNNTLTSVAIVKNQDSYTFEIYRDSVDAIRARFTLSDNLLSFPGNFCPTFQIDAGIPRNDSINNAPCLSGATWAEFILGYVENDLLESSTVTGLMNGVNLKFRFMLANGDYRETLFSLVGSKRAVTAALGEDIIVRNSARNP